MIACIWDYFGKDSKGTAEHFEKHLKEFIKVKNIQNIVTGTQANKEVQSFVWCAGNKDDLLLIIELLKPKHYLNKENFNEFGIHI
ncbi:hypothetical protein [Silvanigrella sp.]|jgi:hypothetical protein|uniref:hypothetical protein n=1 Tax=Silvanigrella sp. TaxID=2024976 RepID=UPI0037C562C5